jgi:hypothetical protein
MKKLDMRIPYIDTLSMYRPYAVIIIVEWTKTLRYVPYLMYDVCPRRRFPKRLSYQPVDSIIGSGSAPSVILHSPDIICSNTCMSTETDFIPVVI